MAHTGTQVTTGFNGTMYDVYNGVDTTYNFTSGVDMLNCLNYCLGLGYTAYCNESGGGVIREGMSDCFTGSYGECSLWLQDKANEGGCKMKQKTVSFYSMNDFCEEHVRKDCIGDLKNEISKHHTWGDCELSLISGNEVVDSMKRLGLSIPDWLKENKEALFAL